MAASGPTPRHTIPHLKGLTNFFSTRLSSVTHYDGEANHHKHHAKQDAFLNILCVMSTAAALIEIAESLDPCQLPLAESININARNSAERPAKGKILGPGALALF